jgi:hypothetical protein
LIAAVVAVLITAAKALLSAATARELVTARARRLVNGTGDYPLNDVSEYLVDRCPHVKCSRKVCDAVVFVNPSENRSKQRHKQAERDTGPNTAT